MSLVLNLQRLKPEVYSGAMAISCSSCDSNSCNTRPK
ncbi:MAG: class III lanthipeptide [Actinocatenispora sp.]